MNFPEQICENCLSDLETAIKFRKNCENSDAILSSFVITNAESKTSNEVVFSTDSGDVYKFRAPPSLKVKRIKKELISMPSVEVQDPEPDPELNPEIDLENDADPEQEYEFVDQGTIEYMDGGDSLAEEDDDTVYYVEQLREDELEYYEADEKELGEVDDKIVTEQSKALSNDTSSVPVIKQFKNVSRPPNKFVPKPDNDNITILGSAEVITKENGKKVYRVKRMFKEETKPLKECKLCGNQYKYQHALDSHMRRHNNEKPFECE